MDHLYTRIVCLCCGETIDVPLYCGNRFCPVCSVGRQMRIKDRLTWLIENAPKNPNNRYRHLTLTVTSSSNLPKMIKYLLASFRRLRQRAYWKSHVDGGAFVIEVTGHPGAWHAHIHAIVYGLWLKWETLLLMWKGITKSTGVYITHIPESACVNYLSKYLSKPDCPAIVEEEIAASLKGVRMFAPFGTWHKLNKSYKRPPNPCARCGGEKWHSWDIMNGRPPQPHVKDFPLGRRTHPPNQTAPG